MSDRPTPHVPDPLGPRAGRVVAARALLKAAGRTEQGLFLAEGPQAVREALAHGDVREIFCTPESAGRHADLVQDRPVTVIDERAMQLLSDTVTPSGLVAVCAALDVPLTAVLQPVPRLVAVLIDIRDPGNAGTVLRTADAAGADAVVFAGTCVDPYNGKVVRSAAGSLFHLPVVRATDATAVVAALQNAGVTVLAATGNGEVNLDHAADHVSDLAGGNDLAGGTNLVGPTAWLLGNEAHGLPAGLAAAADARVRIPIHGRAESLNLAVAAAVLLYASARAQRTYPR